MVEIFIEELEVNGIHYGLNLYYSYLLPLFDVSIEDDKLVIVKKHGVCSGLKCIQIDEESAKCFIPPGCRGLVYGGLLGLTKRNIFLKAIGGLKARYLSRFTLIYSPSDKLYVSSTIYLSRTTDYYVNTIKWVREAINLNCFNTPINCRGVSNSYQFVHFIQNIHRLIEVFSRDHGGCVEEALELMKIKGFGVKSAFAYLLHVYGLTEYAPIDRHYAKLIGSMGIAGRVYPKTICLDSKLNCSACLKGSDCLYSLARRTFGDLNGFIQSLMYVYGRLTSVVAKRIGVLETVLLKGIDLEELIKEINTFLKYLIEEKCR